ncbi:ATP-sensitive inward rectifier potassium channel 12-like [Mercenaria mercenaria]|uniref:ATP-sensitive inward rectifier potassium channel 12-like n=1 Tax=Mercenaria mercenaria TaxID=6596 RepID=UPI00234F8E5F|nr:ATP-sensitive inward rectifier potassium channel 12-like [Mercenaria mercenaria]
MENKMRARRRSVIDFFDFVTNSEPDDMRIVTKSGNTTVKLANQPSSKKFFYPNIFISIVELESAWICLIFLTCFLLSWFTFALLYFVVAEANGDFLPADGESQPCVEDVHNFLEMFQFSMETQTTIGYGTRYVTDECPTAILLVVIQSILGVLILTAITGVILFKFQSPKRRAHTVLFSKVACVYEDNGIYFIEIQILNMQRSQLIDPKVAALCIMNREDGSGKCRLDMEFNPCHESSRLFFRPKVFRHLIDKSSPFWDFNRKDFEKGAYEILVVVEGVDEFTDSFVHARTSYLPSEMKWSRHFKQMTAARKASTFKLNFNDFTRTTRSFDMSDESASQASRRNSEETQEENVIQMTEFVNGHVDIQYN